MNEGKFWYLEAVSDAVLQEGLKELLATGARTEARIVAHLAEVDARKLHLAMGASSLFDYCLSRLGLSNNEAFHRITAARLARRFPVIFELLERRDVHLTAVCLLRDHLTIENHAELLGQVSHKTKTEIEELLAQRFPQPNASSRLRKRPGFEPRSEAGYLLQLNVSKALKRKLELARDLMSQANPSGDLAVVVERALDELNDRLQSRRFAQTKSVRADGSAQQGLDSVPVGGDGAARAEANSSSTRLGARWRRHGGKFEPDVPSAQSAARRARARSRTSRASDSGPPTAGVGSLGNRGGQLNYLAHLPPWVAWNRHGSFCDLGCGLAAQDVWEP